MAKWHTFNIDKVLCDETESDEYKAGFERQYDGTLIKMLGDPRCLTSKEAKQKMAERQKYMEKLVIVDTGIEGIKHFNSRDKFSIKEYEQSVTTGTLVVDVVEHLVYENVRFDNRVPLWKVGTESYFNRVQFHLINKNIYLWTHYNSTKPDMMLSNALL
jgi:hypothetical protein